MKKILFMIISILCTGSVSAQDMRTVFVAMPDSITPLLTKVNKEDCVDFLDSNMKAEVTTRFGGKAEMKVLTEDYVLMQTTPVSTLEMKLLPLNDSTKVVCMVRTVCAEGCDSEVHFFASDWSEKLAVSDFMQKPDADAFYLPKDSTDIEERELAVKKADVSLVKASLSKDDATITFVYTATAYMNEEDKAKLVPWLRKEPIVLRWKDGKFSLQ